MLASIAAAAFLLIAPVQDPEPGQVLGSISTEGTGERLAYAVVEVVGLRHPLRAVTDSSGTFVLRGIPPGRRLLRASRFDHSPTEVEVIVPVGGVVSLDLFLVQRPVDLPALTAVGKAESALADTVSAPVAELGRMVGKALESTPGLAELIGGGPIGGPPGQEPVDPTDALFVRGSPADLKLVLLDGAPVYTPFHTAGLIPSFEPDLLRSADLYLGGAPPKYDGGLSYVLGLETRAGRRSGINASGSFDWLSSRTTIEGPVAGPLSFLASGRAVHVGATEWLTGLSFPYGYADALGRLDLDLDGRGRLALTTFWNHEAVRLDGMQTGDRDAEWGNNAVSLRYTSSASGERIDLTAALSSYRSILPLTGPQALFAEGGIRQLRLAADMAHITAGLRVHYGISHEQIHVDYHARPDGEHRGGSAVLFEGRAAGQVTGGYVDADWKPARTLRIRGGVRADAFSTDGVLRFAPRASATWLLSERAALTLAAGRYRQFIRSIDPPVAAADPAGATYVHTSPLSLAGASHLVLALDQDLGEGIRLGIEGFYKAFDGVPAAQPYGGGESLGGATGLDAMRGGDDVEARASGVDLWLHRSAGTVTGWLGYSLAWIWTVDQGTTAGAGNFAGRQLLTAGVSGPLDRYAAFDLRVAYGAGLPYAALPSTAPDLRWERIAYSADAQPALLSGVTSETMNVPVLARTPDDPYIRLDLEISSEWKGRLRGREVRLFPYFRVLNALNRRDALFYALERRDTGELRPLAALPLLPVLGFRWEF